MLMVIHSRDLVSNMIYTIPSVDDSLKHFAKTIGCKWIGAVEVDVKPMCRELHCHTNVLTYINTYGGDRIIGYYFIKNECNGKYEAILHSILKKSNDIIDITPFSDNREYNIVGIVENKKFKDLPTHIIQ